MTSRHILGSLVAAASVVVLAASASASGPAVTLNLKGGLANRELVACRILHHYTFFRVGRPVSMDGTVQPVPRPGWLVKVKVKKCIRGQFRAVWARHTKGKPGGTFAIAYTPHHPGAYFARAYYYGVRPAARSDKQFFHAP